MQCCDRIDQYKNQLIDLENEFASIKVKFIQSLPFPSLEQIQNLSQAIKQISSDEENLTRLILFNCQQESYLSTLKLQIESLVDQCNLYEGQINEKNLLFDSKNNEIVNLKSKLDQIISQDQEIVSKLFQASEEVSNLTQLIEPKRIKLEALRIESGELESKHCSLSNTLALLKEKDGELRLEVETQKNYMEHLISETERLISEKHHLQSKKNDFKSCKSLSILTTIPPKPKPVYSDNCPVCLYPKVGRTKICKICNSVVHHKCMSNLECFKCTPPNK